MRPPRENLYRATTGVELRDNGSGMPTLVGHFAVWDTWTPIRSAFEGTFLERFAAGSMTKTLAESPPKVLFQHGRDPQVGDKPLGIAARVQPDERGAAYEVPLFDTAYNRELLPGLREGAYGASFRFSVVREDVVQKPKKSEFNPDGIPERTVQEARVMEFGPVTFPAYAAATAGIRSLTDEFLFDALVEDKERLRALLTSAGVTFTTLDFVPVEPEPSGATTDDRAPEPEPSGATTHSEPRGLFWFAEAPKKRSQ
jgi:hypothetical protein